MNPQDPRTQLEQVIALAKFGNQPQARKLVFQLLEAHPGYLPGWLWAAELAKDQRERPFCRRRILAIAPNPTAAKEYLNRLAGAEINEVSRREHPAVAARLDARKHRPINWIGHFHLRIREIYCQKCVCLFLTIGKPIPRCARGRAGTSSSHVQPAHAQPRLRPFNHNRNSPTNRLNDAS